MPRLLAVVFVALPAAVHAAPPDFDKQIALLLASHCLDCHRGPKAKGDLDLSRRDAVLGEGGPVVPGKPGESSLWERVDAGEMPPKKPLPAADRQLLKAWIEGGAQWGTDPIDPFRFTTATRAGYDWWALRPVTRPAVPAGRDHGGAAWVRNPIDAFILAKLSDKSLSPSPAADRRTLLRRVTFDLTGLPPTPDEIDAFLKDTSADAYEKVVDRLLASPHYGERWGRHWLDVVRYGETDGFERNTPRPNAWPYRNWVIRALNADLPYDEFVRLQLAGDVLRPGDGDAVRATGFLVAGVHNTVLGNDQMRAVARQDELEDLVGAVGQTFLGLTTNCARCHDHKFDPVSQTDYYRLASVLSGVGHGERSTARPHPEGLHGPPPAVKLYVNVPRDPGTTRFLARGDLALPGDVVAPSGLPAVGGAFDFGLAPDAPDAARRRALAAWVTAPTNPLFARVMVNRVWHHHFGTGIVETPSDFGFNGGRPSHPELLDWLASEFVNPESASGRRQPAVHDVGQKQPADAGRSPWSLKHLHKLIVTSAAYRQSSLPQKAALAADADTRLLWRMKPRRLEGEAVRDAMLAVSGLLNREVGGKGFSDYKETFLNGTTYFEPFDPAGEAFHRRSVYRFLPRGGNLGLLDTFDCPDPAAAAPRRAVTTTPLQALSLWNGGFALRVSEAFAARVEADAPDDPGKQVTRAWRLAFQRDPTAAERAAAEKLVADHGLRALCRALFNANEFLTVG